MQTAIQHRQRTISRTVSCTGLGLHSGRRVTLTLKPAHLNHGIKFLRKDLPDQPVLSAHFNMVVDTSLATVIGYNGFIVSTIEHLMASLAGLSIDNALVEIDGYEVPIMDGSAGPFTRLIRSAGVTVQPAPRCYFVVKKPILFEKDGKSVHLLPSQTFKITYTIEYPHPMILQQSYSIDVTGPVFEKEISRARTFGFLNEIEYLKKYGFAKGASLENAIVVNAEGVLNRSGLRHPDEFVRHKILDCIGDFSLLGMPFLGHLILHKSGHAFNHEFLKEFFARRDAWETCMFHEPSAPLPAAANSLAIS
jgi:UDP-3-O-[3-hydroxymyristoyl] N-acetylglucosamine deacetylase